MSKLPHAPLIEVIFELRWTTQNQKLLLENQYLHGDLYPRLRKKYPFRETIQTLPPELFLQAPTHRFRTEQGGYPLVQVGPGILTVNTTDQTYFWNDYEKRILEVIENLQEVFPLNRLDNITLVLQYIDLLKFEFDKNDIGSFLKENLNIELKQNFFQESNPRNINLSLNFETKLGVLSVNIGRGKDLSGFDGIAIHTNLSSVGIAPDPDKIKAWLSEAHELCSSSFKKMTNGNLYDSFK